MTHARNTRRPAAAAALALAAVLGCTAGASERSGGDESANGPAATSSAATATSAERPAGAAARIARAGRVTVFKSPACGCCTNWVAHLREHGFDVETVDTDALADVKERYGVPSALRACHTAVVDGYVIEGHVPADLVRRLLEERPAVDGLAVPGMPVGSPGMEGSYAESYDVLTFTSDGATEVYARH